MNIRRPSEADVTEVVALLRAVEEADSGEAEWDEPQLRDHWAKIDLERDAWLIEEDGRVAGYADFEVRPAGRLMADGYVHPELKGRGIGSTILRITEEEARKRMDEIDGRVYLQNATTADAASLYEPHGYSTVRRFRRLAIDLDAQPAVPELPGVVLRPLQPGEERDVHALLEHAFAEHWEHHPREFDEYARETFARDDFDPTLCVVAEADGTRTGASLNWWKEVGDWGWIGTVGVLSAARGRGIGAALVLASFAEFWRRGERRVALGVDAQNETGALRLYERLGMRTLWEAPIWQKELRGA